MALPGSTAKPVTIVLELAIPWQTVLRYSRHVKVSFRGVCINRLFVSMLWSWTVTVARRSVTSRRSALYRLLKSGVDSGCRATTSRQRTISRLRLGLIPYLRLQRRQSFRHRFSYNLTKLKYNLTNTFINHRLRRRCRSRGMWISSSMA